MIIKVMNFFLKIIFLITIFKVLLFNSAFAQDQSKDFEIWLTSYKKDALKKGVSQETIDMAFKNVKFLEQVIKYDRKQPEFIEDTVTYVNKRANLPRARTAKKLLIHTNT